MIENPGQSQIKSWMVVACEIYAEVYDRVGDDRAVYIELLQQGRER